MSEHDVVIQKLDEILTILKTEPPADNNTGNTAPPPSNTASSYEEVVSEVKQVLSDAAGSTITSFSINTHITNGVRKTTIEIKG